MKNTDVFPPEDACVLRSTEITQSRAVDSHTIDGVNRCFRTVDLLETLLDRPRTPIGVFAEVVHDSVFVLAVPSRSGSPFEAERRKTNVVESPAIA